MITRWDLMICITTPGRQKLACRQIIGSRRSNRLNGQAPIARISGILDQDVGILGQVLIGRKLQVGTNVVTTTKYIFYNAIFSVRYHLIIHESPGVEIFEYKSIPLPDIDPEFYREFLIRNVQVIGIFDTQGCTDTIILIGSVIGKRRTRNMISACILNMQLHDCRHIQLHTR